MEEYTSEGKWSITVAYACGNKCAFPIDDRTSVDAFIKQQLYVGGESCTDEQRAKCFCARALVHQGALKEGRLKLFEQKFKEHLAMYPGQKFIFKLSQEEEDAFVEKKQYSEGT